MSSKRTFLKQLAGLVVAPAVVPEMVTVTAGQEVVITHAVVYPHLLWMVDPVTGQWRQYAFRIVDVETVEIEKGVACG